MRVFALFILIAAIVVFFIEFAFDKFFMFDDDEEEK
jgi:hypothetical protein